ncbi:MAG TPA: restriction endonuclease [Candidatus Acidoferrum sp.]|jgi:restriction system protein|nr:restriction endonuclease [Candidatus Acidoferrum sp.]
MTIPDYQTLMLPVLKVAGDGQEHRISDVVNQLARDFGLTEEEQQQILPSGRQATFANRVGWAKTYLVQAGLLEATKRAHFKITDRGKKSLADGPPRIDVEYLSQFAEFVQFKERGRLPGTEASTNVGETPSVPLQSETPDELLRSTVKQIETALKKELLDRILAAPPAFFEGLIVALLLAMGYGGSREQAGKIVGRSGDGGIDGVIDQDALGLDRVYVQAKRYVAANAVSEPEIRAFSGSLGAAKANKGVFVTTSYFTQPAQNFAERHPFKIVLIDGERLAALMIRHNVGVRIDETLYLKKMDEDFFVDE